MKRRNAESGKMRRPIKRTKITEGMYSNSMLYLKFVMLWVTVVMADYMLNFRLEFLYPFWMMLTSMYDSFKYHGIAFSLFFLCMALTSDLICYFFIPLQYLFFAAGTYVWIHYVWYTFADKGVCLPTVAICCLVVYVEGALRARTGPLEPWRPLAAHCLGYPALTLGFGVKSYVGQRLRLRRQRQVRAENEFYFQLLRDALPESALEQNGQSKEECKSQENEDQYSAATSDARHMNGSVRRRCARDHNGVCVADHPIHVKLEKLEKHLAQQSSARDKAQASAHATSQASAHAHSNGAAGGPGAPADDDRHDHSKGSGKPAKCEKKEASTVREERRKHKNRDKDKDKECSDSHKSTEQSKEILIKEKEAESTKETVKSNKDNNNSHKDRDKEKEREKKEEKERETREREQKEREVRTSRELSEELKRVRTELNAAKSSEAEAKRALAAAAAAERARRADHLQLRQAHAQLQHKMSSWRSGERAALERRLSEERRARTNAEHQLLRARHANRTPNGECENEWCKSRRTAQEADTATLRRELQKARDRASQLQKDLMQATEQVRSLETRAEEVAAAGGATCGPRLVGACAALQERAAHLERSLSAETRVKLDLLSALGEAKRHLHIQEGLISRQEKEIAELKAQMLAVMPNEFVTPVSGTVSKLRLSDGSPLDPNASVYTPKQLCSDA